MHRDLTIRAMTRQEFDLLVDWAAAEGWNPGLEDAEIFWQTDLGGFLAAEIAGELVGGGSIVSYDGRFGFMGFFIVRSECRGRGLGTQLWFERLRRLRARLQPTATIGLDGVFAMQSFYAKGGFVFAARGLRQQGAGVAAERPAGVVPLTEVGFAAVAAYDDAHFPAP